MLIEVSLLFDTPSGPIPSLLALRYKSAYKEMQHLHEICQL